MALSYSTTMQNLLAAAFTAAIDAGSAGGTVEVRTGSKPANANAAATGTLLFTWTLDPVSFGSPSAGVAALDATPVITTTGVAAGTAGWFRVKDSAGVVLIDGEIPADLALDNTVIAIGQTVNLPSGTLTQPAA